MSVPLAVTASAAAGGLAYLNAKGTIWHDWMMLKSTFTMIGRMILRKRSGRLNMFTDLEHWAQNPQKSNQTALVFQNKSYTYSQLYDAVLRYGNWMKSELGVKPNQIVAMDFDNSDLFIIVWFALWSIGAKPAFINYNLTGKSLAHCIRVSTANLCIADPSLLPNLDAIKDDLKQIQVVSLDSNLQRHAASFTPIREPDSVRSGQEPTDIALLIFTSGTTGLPKPAVVSWTKVLGASTSSSRLCERGNGDIMYAAMPLYHSLASLMGWCGTLMVGSTLVLGRKFSPSTFWQEIRQSNATIVLYIGEALRYLLAAPPQYDPVTNECLDKKHSVKVLHGSGLRPDVWQKFKDRFGIDTVVELYGATEGPVALFNVSRNSHSVGSVGQVGWLLSPLFNSRAKLVVVDWEQEAPWRDPTTGRCRAATSGERGELLFRVPPDDIKASFQGYLNNKKANDEKVLRNVFAEGDAWFRTGDVLFWANEGQLYFSDRLGDTFRWKSENVATMEVGHVIGSHPAVREANVYGVELPHHDGRAGCAAITFDTPEPTEQILQSLADYLTSSLPRYAVPIFLRLVEEVGTASQTTGTNKQQKQILRLAGVNPKSEDGQDVKLFWLKGNTYVPFTESAWRELQGGRVKL